MAIREQDDAAQCQRAQGKTTASVSERFSNALASIDRQAPSLTYLGLGFWIAWNTIAFSGSFWLHETDNSNITENLMLVHLLACFITLLLVALFADRFSKWVAKNRTTFIGGLVAAVGTLLICNARNEVLGAAVPHFALTVLFNSGCVLAGVGTTMLFVRAAALFGTLPPHRALYRLAECTLFSIAIYFVLNGCPQPIAVAAFIALPVMGAALFCIRRKDLRGEKQVLDTPVKLTRRFCVLLASIGLCSTALELIRAYVLISVPPMYAIGANVVSQLIEVPLMIAIMAAVLLAKSRRDGFAKMYSVAACALTVLIVCIAMFSLNTPAVASGAWVVCTCYNMVVWAMLYYLVYQWRGGALRIVAFGNAALSGGTLVASLLAMAYQASHISESVMKVIIALIGVAVLIDVLFVFSEKQINNMLLPVDEGGADSTDDSSGIGAARQPGRWKLACEEVARTAGLSARETEVFLGLARGRTAQEIADREVVSIYTIRAHTRSIYAKLDVHSKKELTALVQKQVDQAG